MGYDSHSWKDLDKQVAERIELDKELRQDSSDALDYLFGGWNSGLPSEHKDASSWSKSISKKDKESEENQSDLFSQVYSPERFTEQTLIDRAKKCTCDTRELIAFGCKCGSFKAEKELEEYRAKKA